MEFSPQLPTLEHLADTMEAVNKLRAGPGKKAYIIVTGNKCTTTTHKYLSSKQTVGLGCHKHG